MSSIDALLNELPADAAADLRAKFGAILGKALAALKAGGDKAEIMAATRQAIRRVSEGGAS